MDTMKKLTSEQINSIPKELETLQRKELADKWGVTKSLINYWVREFKKRGIIIPKLSRSAIKSNETNSIVQEGE